MSKSRVVMLQLWLVVDHRLGKANGSALELLTSHYRLSCLSTGVSESMEWVEPMLIASAEALRMSPGIARYWPCVYTCWHKYQGSSWKYIRPMCWYKYEACSRKYVRRKYVHLLINVCSRKYVELSMYTCWCKYEACSGKYARPMCVHLLTNMKRTKKEKEVCQTYVCTPVDVNMKRVQETMSDLCVYTCWHKYEAY